jgi:uncharacterized protein YndB with AHSA1/START domain
MAIHFEHGIDVSVPPAEVFEALDDVSRTPRWLERCTGVEKMSPGANAVGTRLRYSYREGGRSGVMDGQITARTPNERLTYHYADTMMDVVVDFRMNPQGTGTHLVHAIDITPKTLVAKLFAGAVRKQLPSQTVNAMERLRSMLLGVGG